MTKPRSANRLRKRAVHRRGVAIVESTIVLSVCLLMLLGMLELTTALVRYTVMSQAARRVARAAIVHGAKAPAQLGNWGPSALDTTADSNSPAAAAVDGTLMTLNPANVNISVRWLDGGNEPDQRVQVTVTTRHTPLVSLPGWYSQLDLEGISTMRIAH